MTSFGIDIGGTRTKAALVDTEGTVLATAEQETQYEEAALIALVCDLVEQHAPVDTPIGIGSPGLASADNRSIGWMQGRLDAVEGLVWCERLGRNACWVLNDAHAATLGEAWLGAAAGVQNALILTLGTGVGGGVVLNGELFQGPTGRAGHFGHITVNAHGAPDIVGTPGSLEDAVGNHTVEDRTQGRFPDTADLVAAYEAGDQDAAHRWRKSVEILAAGLTSLINTFDPEVIVVGGGIAKCGPLLFDPLHEAMERFEWRPFGKRVHIVPAKLGGMAGSIGAARFASLQTQQASPS